MQSFQLILRDDPKSWQNLLPLTYTRPISLLRVGIDTIKEKWEHFLNQSAEIETQDYLLPKFQNKQTEQENTLIVNSSCIPTKPLIDRIKALNPGEQLVLGDLIVAEFKSPNSTVKNIELDNNIEIISINYPFELFKLNDKIFRLDFDRLTNGHNSQPIPSNNQILGKEQIFLEEGATVQFSILDASKSPIYLGKNSTIMSGSMINGGLALCEGSTLKMGTKHYGTSTIGPGSKFGGEISNIVVQGFSNKGHDGFLGNAVLGEWCNLGADTNASNLKNNYGFIRVWNYLEEKFQHTEEQFCGLIMGDHSKAGINTMFNTATVIGVGANIFGAGYPKTFLPSFTWGGVDFHRTFTLTKVYEMAESMMKRRNIPFTETDKSILEHIFEASKKYRKD